MSNTCEKYLRVLNDFGSGAQELPIFAKIRFIKQTINDVSNKVISADDVEQVCVDFFDENASNLGIRNETQKETLAIDCAKMILRYVNYETRTPVFPPAKLIDNGKIKKMVKPDRAFIYPDTVGNKIYEVVRIKCSKPHITQTDADKGRENAIALYELLNYGRTLIRGKGVEHVVASFYYLGKASDKYETTETLDSHYDAGFFDAKGSFSASTGAKNIIRLVETYRNGRLVTAEYDSKKGKVILLDKYDDVYAEAIDKTYRTKDSNECTPSDCEKCEIKDMCHYTMPPLAIEAEKETTKAKRMKLNPAQQAATDYDSGVVRINAGAGTGKTNTVKSHFISLCDKGVDPRNILVITFTNSGAEEMRARILSSLSRNGIDVDPNELSIMTFNAFGYSQIKEHYKQLGYTSSPKLIDDIERSAEIAKILNNTTKINGLNYRNFSTNTKFTKGALALVSMVFSLAKKYSLSISDADECRRLLADKYNYSLPSMVCSEILRLYPIYDDNLHTLNLIEFDDQLTALFELIYQDPDFIEKLGYEHIIVDEFQDTDEQQINLLKEMINTSCFKSLMVVGDDSQAIYGFRDTDTKYIIHFEDYIGRPVDDIFLVENYRCSPEIIDFANNINSYMTARIEKDLVATRPSNDPVTVMGFGDSTQEYSYIADQIRQNIENGTKPENICFIAYSKSELQKMADILTAMNIPSVLMNPELLKDNSRVQAGLALFRALQNPKDNIALMTYASARSNKKITDASYTVAKQILLDAQTELEYCRRLPENAKKQRILEMLKELDKDDEVFESFIATIEFKPSISQMYDYISDFEDFGDRAAFRRNKSYPGVVLTTAHSSKGLEWPIVYVSVSNFYDKTTKYNEHNEIRRLLFVSATRAKERLVITGKWVSFSDKKIDYFNPFLVESFKAIGQMLSNTDLINIMHIYRQEKIKVRNEQKLKKLAEKPVKQIHSFNARTTRAHRKQGRQTTLRNKRIVLK